MDIHSRLLCQALALLIVSVPVVATESSAAGAQSPTAGVRACLAETDAARRLACYDTEVGKMVAGSGPAEQFGVDGQLLQKRLKEGTEPQKPHELTARIASITRRSNGQVAVRLDNDQIWEQSDDGPDLRMEVGDAVKIDRGMLGSYWLSAHSSVAIKVRRTQ